MVVVAAGQTVEGVDHDDLEPASVLAAVLHQALELGSIPRLCRLAPLDKDSIHHPALILAESSRGLSLRRQTQVLRLLLGRDPAVDHRPHQLTPVSSATLVMMSLT